MAAREYPRAAVTADVVSVHCPDTGDAPGVLLIRRARDPYAGRWALPGGFVDPGESPKQAAKRELLEETGTKAHRLIQIGAYGEPGRDPRGWTVSVAYLCLRLGGARPKARAADDATSIDWRPLTSTRNLAFDHGRILADTRRRIRELLAAPERCAQLIQRGTAPLGAWLALADSVAVRGESFNRRSWSRHLRAAEVVRP